jgi:adenine-specific DNA-methyltransferase
MNDSLKVTKKFSINNTATLYHGDCINLLNTIPNKSLQLVITSPPYNIGKNYERRISLDEYFAFQKRVINLCIDKLSDRGSICWEVGNYVDNGSIIPLDILLHPIFSDRGLKLRNRIVWHFRHGLHASKRFSGRYEMILWYSKTDKYTFNLDDVRIAQKYPGKKHFKGKKKGEYSSNPLGMNPSDAWIEPELTDYWDIPNVKSNHIEKTIHPAQFPIAMIQRLIKALSNKNDIVFDPFMGSGTTTAAGIMIDRKVVGAETMKEYYDIAINRTKEAYKNIILYREDKPVYEPSKDSPITINPFGANNGT